MFRKVSSKYIQVGSCFEDLLERDTVAQSEFEFDVLFKNYNFLNFEVVCMCHDLNGGGLT